MGLRFRKSFKIAPGLKINLNKNSISATVGTKGAHYTVNSKGKRTASVGIPGTGIYYTESSGGQKSKSNAPNDTNAHYNAPQSGEFEPNDNRNNKKKWYQKTGWIIAWLILCFPVGLFLMWKYSNWKKPVKGIVSALFAFMIIGAVLSPTEPLESAKLSVDTSKAYDIKQEVQIKSTLTPSYYALPDSAYKTSGGNLKVTDEIVYFQADKAGMYEIWLDYDGIKSNKVKIKVEDKKAIAKQKAKEEAKKKAEEEAKKKAEEEKRKAEEEAARKAEEERIAAEQAAAQKAEEEARIKAEQDAQAAEEAARIQAEQEAQSQQQEANVGGTVYWTPNGEVYHSTADCPSLGRSKTIFNGSVSESGKSRPCKVCY